MIVSSFLLVLCRAAITHNRTLEVRPGRISKTLELHYDYDVKGVMRLWDDNIHLLNFASMFIYSVLQMLACFFVVFDSSQLSQYFNEAMHTIHYAAPPKLRQMPPKTLLVGR